MKKIKAKNIILILLAVICVAVLLYSLYQGLVIYIPQKQEQQRFDELRQIVSQDSEAKNDSSKPAEAETKSSSVEEKKISAFSELKKTNADFRGWLKIKDMVIDYPVVKSSDDDPEFYLHRDIDKNYSFSGTPFIGAGADENSDVFVIYAHNMNNGTMFGTLDCYADKGWAEQHPYINFDTVNENRIYRVFAAFRTTIGSENEFKYNERAGKLSDEEYKALVNDIKDVSVMFTNDCPAKKTQIIMLSTCSYHAENGRFVVAAYRV
jgi:sortase B